jgi:hypothetical protein
MATAAASVTLPCSSSSAAASASSSSAAASSSLFSRSCSLGHRRFVSYDSRSRAHAPNSIVISFSLFGFVWLQKM